MTDFITQRSEWFADMGVGDKSLKRMRAGVQPQAGPKLQMCLEPEFVHLTLISLHGVVCS